MGGDSDQITTNAQLHMMGSSMLSCLMTDDDEIARLSELIIPKTFTMEKIRCSYLYLLWERLLKFTTIFYAFFGSRGLLTTHNRE